MPKAKAVRGAKAAEIEAAAGKRFNRVTFRVIWNGARHAYEVHGDDGQIHSFSADKQKMIDAAIRKAKRASKLGMQSAACVQQKDGSFKVEWSS